MKRILIASILTMAFAHYGHAQNTTLGLDLKAKTKADAEEVYKDYTVYTSQSQLDAYEAMEQRVEIKTMAPVANEGYPLLSTIGLRDKYNPTLTRDNAQSFNPNTFNPLKYFFEFFTNQDKNYRVDGTDYVICIHHK